MRVCNVRLVTPNDKNYRDYCQRFALSKMTLREKKGPSKTCQFSMVAERMARSWVASCTPIMEERILSYRQFYSRANLWCDGHREIDIVTGTDEPEVLIEVKFTSANITCVSMSGKRQLLESYSIAKYKWALLRACTIGVSLTSNAPTNLHKLYEAINRCPTKLVDAADIPHVVIGARPLWESEYDKIKCDPNLLDDAMAEYQTSQKRREEREANRQAK